MLLLVGSDATSASPRGGGGLVSPRAPRCRLASTCREMEELVRRERIQEVGWIFHFAMADMVHIWRISQDQRETPRHTQREGKQTDNGKSTPRRRWGEGQARRTVLLMMVAVMLSEAIAAMVRPSEANTHCFQKGSFQTDQKREREEDWLLIGERRAQVRSEFQEQDTSSVTRWNEKKRH